MGKTSHSPDRATSPPRSGRAASAGRAGLFVMARWPAAGACKTRLARTVGAARAAALYEAFVADTLRLAAGHRGPRIVLVDPPGRCADFAARFPCRGLEVLPQAAGSLGARMRRAVEAGFQRGLGRVVLVGTDAPGLRQEWLREAFRRLRAADVVLGPSLDGGYYLVGLSRPQPGLFARIPWSTERVFEVTLRRLQGAGVRLGLLPPYYDIDEAEDLERLRRELLGLERAGERVPERTFATLLGRNPDTASQARPRPGR